MEAVAAAREAAGPREPAAAPGGGQAPQRPKKRTGTSKYDFVKVKVWLGESMDHYYVLSRFLICRMLTVTKIPWIKAVKIALETKKYLVDNNLLDVTQAQLESVLFSLIRAKGLDEAHIDCYRLVTAFYQSRTPLCIIICGAAWTGKSTLAQQLASRINIPNVMQTDVIYELLRADPDTPLHSQPLWARQLVGGSGHLPGHHHPQAPPQPGGVASAAGGGCCCTDAALVAEFRREARVVRKGMDGDLIKTLSDGKPIIIEGMHLDPGLYIPDFGRSGIIMLPARPSATAAAATAAATAAAAAARSPGSSPLHRGGGYARSLSALPRCAAAAAAAAAGQQPAPDEQPRRREDLPGSRQRPVRSASLSVSASGPLWSADAAATLSQQQQPQQPQQPPAQRQQQQQQQQHVTSQQQPQQHSSQTTAGECSSSSTISTFDRQPELSHCDARGAWRDSTAVHQRPQRLRQHQPRQGSPFAAPAAAAVAAAAAEAAPSVSLSGPSGAAAAAATGSPGSMAEGQGSVVMLRELQVCAAAAEAAALHNARTAQLAAAGALPGSPFSADSDSTDQGGVGGASPPCISQEHSTTEVVSRACSCGSLASMAALSQEPSASDLGVLSPAAAAAAAAANGLPPSARPTPRSRASPMARAELQQQAAQLEPQQQAVHMQQAPPLRGQHSRPPSGSRPRSRPLSAGAAGSTAATATSSQGGSAGGTLPVRADSGISTAPQWQPEQPQLVAIRQVPAQQASAAAAAGAGAALAVPPPAAAGGEPPLGAPLAPGRGAAAAAPTRPKQPEAERIAKPLFVPILVYMDEPDHALMAEEALAHLGGGGAGGAPGSSSEGGCGQSACGGGASQPQPAAQPDAAQHERGQQEQPAPELQQQQVGMAEALRRMRLLQEYLCAYEAQGLPLVKVSYGAFGEALDKLHEYVLQCIKAAMAPPLVEP